MGFSVQLETETGEVLEKVDDTSDVLKLILPRAAAEGCLYLPDIDYYGDTVFNVIQGRKVLREWNMVCEHFELPDAKRMIDGVRAMLERLCREVHLYVRFYGD